MNKLVIDGNKVYEIDEECMKKKKKNIKGDRIKEQVRKGKS